MRFESISFCHNDRGRAVVTMVVADGSLRHSVELTRRDLNDVLAIILAAFGISIGRRAS